MYRCWFHWLWDDVFLLKPAFSGVSADLVVGSYGDLYLHIEMLCVECSCMGTVWRFCLEALYNWGGQSLNTPHCISYSDARLHGTDYGKINVKICVVLVWVEQLGTSAFCFLVFFFNRKKKIFFQLHSLCHVANLRIFGSLENMSTSKIPFC